VPKSDDVIEQTRAHFHGETDNVVAGLIKQGIEEIPFVGIAISYIKGKAREDKEKAFDNAVLDILKDHAADVDAIKEKLKSDSVKQLVAVAVERIFWGASEKKVRRFAAVVADELGRDPDPQRIEDAIFFIRALDELSEDDIRVLKHLYNHQKDVVTENHAMPYNSFFQDGRMKSMLTEASNLGIQMDEFYSRCSRLSGYGLALPLDKSHGSMGNPDEFAFRMTLLGKRLIDKLVKTGKESPIVIKPRRP
jgi:hypothetical protein